MTGVGSFEFFIDSRDSIQVGSNPSDVLLVNVLGSGISSDHYTLSVEQCIIPNLEYPVNSKNKSFTMTDHAAGQVVVTLTEGTYTGATLATEVEAKVQAATGDAGYSCTFDSTTSRLTLTDVLPDTFTIDTDNDMLGFVAFTTPTAAYIGDNPIRLDGSTYFDIASNLTTLNLTSSGRTDVLARIQNVVNYGGLNFYDNRNDSDSTQLSGGALDRLHLQLLDDRGRLLELPANSHWSLAIRLSKVK
jgi:hypothetical protein